MNKEPRRFIITVIILWVLRTVALFYLLDTPSDNGLLNGDITPRLAVEGLYDVQTVPEDSVHYGLNNNAEWEALFPGDGLFPDGPREASIGMFHELRCLNILRIDLLHELGSEVPIALINHCLNYLRQTVLCRCSTHLDPLVMPAKGLVFEPQRCKDWTAVYDAVHRKQHAA